MLDAQEASEWYDLSARISVKLLGVDSDLVATTMGNAGLAKFRTPLERLSASGIALNQVTPSFIAEYIRGLTTEQRPSRSTPSPRKASSGFACICSNGCTETATAKSIEREGLAIPRTAST